MKGYLLALSFLTVAPLPYVSFSRSGEKLSASAAWFPLVGATLGLFYGGAAWLLLFVLPGAPVALFILLLAFLLTRGLHHDGLADTADGLIGTTNRDGAFKAMDDSAVGVMGAVVLVFACLFKFVLLVELGGLSLLPEALFLMPLVGRWAVVFSGALFGPARDRGLGDLFLRDLGVKVLIKASLGALVVLALFFFYQSCLVLAVLIGSFTALVSALLLSLYANSRLGGLSGDVLGASCEIGEILFLFGFYLTLTRPGF